MHEEGWIDSSREVPEEETTVLVYMDCDFVTLGILLEGGWETIVAPWDSTPGGCSEVLYWRPLPWPPAELLGVPAPEAKLKLAEG